ncbi:gp58-like family protein [Oenococcus oeni]
MITQTTAATAAWKAPQRTLDTVAMIDGTDYHTSDITSIAYDGGAFTGDTFSIGSTYENSVTITFSHLIEGFVQGQLVAPKVGVKLADGTFEYSPLGIFVISDDIEMDRNNDVTTIKAYDLMCMLEGTYTSKITYPAKMTDVIAEIASLSGVPLNSDDIARLPLMNNLAKAITGQTYRNAIGWIAQFYSGFALFDRDGKLTIRAINDTDYAIDAGQYLQGGLTKNEAAYVIGGIQCQVTTTTTDSDGNSTDDTVTLQSGSSTGSQVQLTNNVMTQERLDAIWTKLQNLTFYPFSLNWFGNPAIEAGDWFALQDTKGNRFNVPNCSYTMTFDGSFSSVSSAQQASTSSDIYSYNGDLTSAINKLKSQTAGLNSYTHIAYADDATGKGFSQDPTGKAYLGVYTDSNSIDSTDPAKYVWMKTKGSDGEDGTSVESSTVAYQAATSGTITPTGTWASDIPVVPAGQYLWTKTVFHYSDDSTSTTYSVSYFGTNGSNGTAGIPGADGKTPYFHTAYSTASDGSTGFSTTDPTNKTYLGTYSDFTQADSTSPVSYDWVKIQGNTGATGSIGATGATGKGITSTVITYQASTSGTVAPSGTWSSSIPSVSASQYLWTRTVMTFSDGASTTSYSVGMMGATGAKGDTGMQGIPGANGQSSYLHIAYADSADGKTNFSITSAGLRQYIGTYTDFTSTSSSDPTKYVWQQTKGDTGAQGPAGTDITAITYGSTAPSSPKEGDVWYKPNGNSIQIEIYHNGSWVLDIDDSIGQRITDATKDVLASAKTYTDDTAKNVIAELSSANKIVNSEFDTDTAQKNVVESSTTVPTPNSKGYADQTIVGRNLLRNTSAFANTDHWSNSGGGSSLAIVSHAFYQNGQGKLLKLSTSGTTEVFLMSEHFSVQAGESYTFQIKAFNNSNVASMDFFALGRPTGSTSDYTKVVASKLNMQPSISGIGTFSFSFTVPDGIGELYIRIDNNGSKVSGSSADLYVAEMKLEVGSLTPYIKAPEDLAIANWQDTIVHDPVDGTYVVSGTTSTKASTVQVKNSAGTIVASQDLSQPKNSDQTFTQGSFSAVIHDNDDGTGTASIPTPTAGTSLIVVDELNKNIYSNNNMSVPNLVKDSEMLLGLSGTDSDPHFSYNLAGFVSIVANGYNGHNVLDIKRSSGSGTLVAITAYQNSVPGDAWSMGFYYRVLTDTTFSNDSSCYFDPRTSTGTAATVQGKTILTAGTAWRYVKVEDAVMPSTTAKVRFRFDMLGTGHIQIALPMMVKAVKAVDYVSDTIDVSKWAATLPADGKSYKATIKASKDTTATILNFNMPTAIDRYNFSFSFPAVMGNYTLVLSEATYSFTVQQNLFPVTSNGYVVSKTGVISGKAPNNTSVIYLLSSSGGSYSTGVQSDGSFAIAVNTDGSSYTIHAEYQQSYLGLTDWHDFSPDLPASSYISANELVSGSKVIEVTNNTLYADDIPSFANAAISVGAQFKLISGTAKLAVVFYKNDGTNLGTQSVSIAGSDWTNFSLINIVTPANVDYIRVMVQAPSGTVRFTRAILVFSASLPAYTPGIGISGKGVLGLFNNNYVLGMLSNAGAVVSGINGNADGLRLTGKTISLDGDTVATGDFWASQINAIKINAANIVAGELDANIVHVIHLDVSSLTGDITSFIKSNWADPYGNNIDIEGSEISLHDNQKNYEMLIKASEIDINNLNDGSYTKISNGNIEMANSSPTGHIESVGGLLLGENVVDERLNGIYLIANTYGKGGTNHNIDSDSYWAADDVGIAYRNDATNENFGVAYRYNVTSGLNLFFAPVDFNGYKFNIQGAGETFNLTWVSWSDLSSGWKYPAIHSYGSAAKGGIAIGGNAVYAFGLAGRTQLI